MAQKYHRGDRVLLKKKFPDYMSHFDHKGEEVIIQYSYGDRYGRPNSGGGYSILGKYLTRSGKEAWGSSAWYEAGNIQKLIRSKHPEDMKLLEKYWRG